MTDRLRVLIVDDSAAARGAFKSLLASDPGLEIQAAVADPYEAAEQMRKAVPDVMLLDLELPRMDGLTFLRRIMAQHPLPVVICSSHTQKGSEAALRALELGAAEVIGKPAMSTPEARQEAQVRLCDAIRAAAQARRGGPAPAAPVRTGPKLTADAVLPRGRPPAEGQAGPLVAVGASTGGTEALLEVLRALPATCPPVVVVQHMPEKFTAAFARRLDGQSALRIIEAASGDVLRRGTALIAPGNHHLIVRRQGRNFRAEVTGGPCVSRHRPSVDVLFRSVAQAAGPNALGVLMTGMGDDGAQGLLEMREAGAETLAQDEATSVVFGMPREALRLGATERAVALGVIPREIVLWRDRRQAA